jgi:predicted SprT family Zn-dependent metalloprotease
MFVWQDSHNAKFEDRTLGTTQCNASGTVCVITLDSFYNKANVTAQLSLLHEMCHADTTGKNFDPHGEAWHACMDRLYKVKALEGLL